MRERKTWEQNSSKTPTLLLKHSSMTTPGAEERFKNSTLLQGILSSTAKRSLLLPHCRLLPSPLCWCCTRRCWRRSSSRPGWWAPSLWLRPPSRRLLSPVGDTCEWTWLGVYAHRVTVHALTCTRQVPGMPAKKPSQVSTESRRKEIHLVL